MTDASSLGRTNGPSFSSSTPPRWPRPRRARRYVCVRSPKPLHDVALTTRGPVGALDLQRPTSRRCVRLGRQRRYPRRSHPRRERIPNGTPRPPWFFPHVNAPLFQPFCLCRQKKNPRQTSADRFFFFDVTFSARRFQAVDGRFYEWRRSYPDPKSYEVCYAFGHRPSHCPYTCACQLYPGPNTSPIAVYRHFPQASPIGPTHGTLEYNFTDGLFLLQMLLALNLNRWLDWNVD